MPDKEEIKRAKDYRREEYMSGEFFNLLCLIDKDEHRGHTFYLKLPPDNREFGFVYGTYIGLAGKEPHVLLESPVAYNTKNDENISSGIKKVKGNWPTYRGKYCHSACFEDKFQVKNILRGYTKNRFIYADATRCEPPWLLAVNLFDVKGLRIHDERGKFVCSFGLDFKFPEKK